MAIGDELHIVRSWCLKELTFWQTSGVALDQVMASFAEVNAQHRTIFLLTVTDGAVSVADKEDFYTREELDDLKSTDPSIIRINAYRVFIEQAIKLNQKNINTTMAMDVNDIPFSRNDMPLFGFQKHFDSRAILLPDIDLVRFQFYRSDEFNDPHRYEDKTNAAIFIGSTTGGGLISKKAVEELAVKRIRSAVYFKNNSNVEFRLPNIVQCDSEETDDLIRSLGISGKHTPFADQLGSKFIISMDGNGATCSRVAIALKSNSVLLKYDSPYVLHYFSQLIPWLHYIPITLDSDIEKFLHIERHSPGHFKFIADEGAAFFNSFLTQKNVLQYTAELIAMYAEILDLNQTPITDATFGRTSLATTHCTSNAIDLDPLLHVQNVGDVTFMDGHWIGARGAGMAIEGFALHPSDDYLSQNLEYSAIQRDLSPTLWHHSGEFCGSRGKNVPILGINIRIGGPQSHLYQCSYTATCVDGSRTSLVVAGELCRGETQAPLEALRICLYREDKTPV